MFSLIYSPSIRRRSVTGRTLRKWLFTDEASNATWYTFSEELSALCILYVYSEVPALRWCDLYICLLQIKWAAQISCLYSDLCLFCSASKRKILGLLYIALNDTLAEVSRASMPTGTSTWHLVHHQREGAEFEQYTLFNTCVDIMILSTFQKDLIGSI